MLFSLINGNILFRPEIPLLYAILVGINNVHIFYCVTKHTKRYGEHAMEFTDLAAM